MNDPQSNDPLVAPQSTPASQANGAADDSGKGNPLDALEQILNEAKQKAGDADAKKKSEEEAALAAKQEEERQMEEYRRIQAQKKAEDAERIRQNLAGLHSISETPEEQARQQQVAEKQEEDEQRKREMKENQIIQLDHTKIAL